MLPFKGRFTQQEPLPPEAVDNVLTLLQTGCLHRYNMLEDGGSAVAELEAAYALYQGVEYCLACTSGGYALALALRANGVKPGDRVLTNGFTLAPVPGAIAAVNAHALLVEITPELVIDLGDLEKKVRQSGARALVLSHMRGHICDMEVVAELCSNYGVTLIEDCAHTMGACWNGQRSGNFGQSACFSTQTYKHLNSGEGGLLTSNDPSFMAKATVMSGSYMLYERHGAAPHPSYFEDIRLDTPNMSGRMDNLRASVLLPQLRLLDANVSRWKDRYDAIASVLSQDGRIQLIDRPDQEMFVGSSIQFRIPGFTDLEVRIFLDRANSLGVDIKWFGCEQPVGFTSNHHSWKYLEVQDLPITDSVLSRLFDVRIPLTFSVNDCEYVGQIIVDSVMGAVEGELNDGKA